MLRRQLATTRPYPGRHLRYTWTSALKGPEASGSAGAWGPRQARWGHPSPIA